MNIKETRAHDDWTPGPGLLQIHKRGGVKPAKGSQSSYLVNYISKDKTHVYIYQKPTQIHFNFNSKKTITKMNDNINIDIAIGRSMNV